MRPSTTMSAKRLRSLLLLPLLLLGGCSLVLLDPSGDVARQQSDIMIVTTVITWLIIVPVMVAIGIVAWRYRASNRKAKYDPDWDHSPQLELVVWAVPLLIIISVGAVSWIGTHQTDPYRPLDRIAAGSAVQADDWPLEVAVPVSAIRRGERQRTGRAGGPADPVQADRRHDDGFVLRAGARGPGLHDARHADDPARGDQQARRVQGLLRQFQRLGLHRH